MAQRMLTAQGRSFIWVASWGSGVVGMRGVGGWGVNGFGAGGGHF